MVKGLKLFGEYFKDYKGQYVLIGGAACDLLMEEVGVQFRATKDLDIVLIVEALSENFGRQLWEFIQEGEYEVKQRSDGTPRFYRFQKPKNSEFPFMIELFSRKQFESFEVVAGGIVPISFGEEVSSLSAILLDEEYYQFLLGGCNIVEGISILSPERIIPLKAKAWVDLSQRKDAGEQIDSRNINKHKNDIIRLTGLLTGETYCPLSGLVKKDMEAFLNAIQLESIVPKALKMKGVTRDEVLALLWSAYIIE